MNIVMLPIMLLLAEAGGGAATAVEPSSLATIISGIIGTLITLFLIPYLHKKRAEATASAALLTADKTKSDIEGRGALVQRLKAFLYGAAGAIAEKEFPKLASDLIMGKVKTKDEIKGVLRSWGATLKKEAADYFEGQGIDIIAAVGDAALDRLIERAANKVSPFPGKETAVELLKDKVSNTIIDKGLVWIKRKIEEHGNIPADELSDAAPNAT